MVAITAGMVSELRAKTDAPMMECKKALVEADGDLAKAEEILRVKLGNKASKAASRITAEGLIAAYVASSGKLGTLVEVNCETDFVAKNDDFIAFSQKIAELVTQNNPADVDALYTLPLEGGTVESVRASLIGKLGENVSVRRFVRYHTEQQLVQYIHGGKIGVMVECSGDATICRDVAMHVAASKPVCVSRDQVPADLVEKERVIYQQQAAESGKAPEIIAKMVEGRINKYLAEVTLFEQAFVKNPDLTVAKMLQDHSANVFNFSMFIVGEGIEKRANDFAAEVAAQAASVRG